MDIIFAGYSDSEPDDAGHGRRTIHRNATEVNNSGHGHRMRHRNAEASRGTITTASSAETSPGHHTSVEKNAASKCPICDRTFGLRKTMLRHLRTVHAPKDLVCPSCDRKFIRQDNLNRHIAEQHSLTNHFVTCESCGRRVSKRGLPEHLQSQICKASPAKITVASSEELGHLYAEDENDCFLLTMRVLKIWLSLAYRKESQKSGKQFSIYGSTSQGFTSSDAYYRCCSLGNRAVKTMFHQMRDKMACQNSLKLFCTTVLWTCISLVGVHSAENVPLGFRDWDAHLKAAAALLKVFHSSTCACDKTLLCPQLQQRATRDPALSLLKAIVRDTGLVGILLRILPSLVTTWEHAIRLIDVLLQCLLNQTDQCGEKIAECQTLCEANGISSDDERNRGLMTLIWAISTIRSDDGPRS